MERLKVKNFGPIKSVNLILAERVLLIGPQSSGKSAIAKLVSVMREPNLLLEKSNFQSLLKSFDIEGYLKSDTEIVYTSKNYNCTYKNSAWSLSNKNESFEDTINKFRKANDSAKYNSEVVKAKKKLLSELIIKLEDLLKSLPAEDQDVVDDPHLLSSFEEAEKLKKEIEEAQKERTKLVRHAGKVLGFLKSSVYIPSDRNLFSTILNTSFSLDLNQIALPSTIKKFGALVEKAKNEIKQFDVDFLSIKYKYSDNVIELEDTKNKKVFSLNQASSGLQSVIPLLQVLLSESRIQIHKTFVVEEPESNLFPKAQYELLQFIFHQCNTNTDVLPGYHNDLIITTHSPYCLSAVNNMLLAFNIGQQTKNEKKVSKIIRKTCWIDPTKFTAYYMENGKASSIIDKQTGLIKENELDSTSYEINNDFEVLLGCIPLPEKNVTVI